MTAKTRKWQALIAFLLLLLSLSCIIPLWLVVSISFTDEAAIVKNGYSLIPSQFSTDAYATIFSGGKQVWRSYGISVFITIAGTIAHVAVTGMAGYSLANPSVRYRNGLAMFFFITWKTFGRCSFPTWFSVHLTFSWCGIICATYPMR